MTSDEIEIAMRMLVGHWQRPELSDDELTMWMRTLQGCEFDIACDVMDSLAETGREFRPNDGLFLSTYRVVRARKSPQPLLDREQLPSRTYETGSYPARVAAAPSAKEKIAILREQIAGLTGPFATSLKTTVEARTK